MKCHTSVGSIIVENQVYFFKFCKETRMIYDFYIILYVTVPSHLFYIFLTSN